ncbi:hypothetical protein ScPMuIL_013752 [Solemya velum]
MDLYFYADQPSTSAWVSLALGYGMLILFGHWEDSIIIIIARLQNKFARVVVTRTYIYVIAFSIIAQWRGAWNVADIYFGYIEWKTGIGSVLIGISVLCAFRSCNVINSTPAFLAFDAKFQENFTNTTRFKCKKEQPVKFFLDIVFTDVFIGTLSIAVWRGMYGLLDVFLYPDDLLKSALYTILIGFVVALITGILEYPAVALSARIEILFQVANMKHKPKVHDLICLEFAYVYIMLASMCGAPRYQRYKFSSLLALLVRIQ